MIRVLVLGALLLSTAVYASGWNITGTGPDGAFGITGPMNAGGAPPPPAGCVPNGELDFSNDGCGMIYIPALIK